MLRGKLLLCLSSVKIVVYQQAQAHATGEFGDAAQRPRIIAGIICGASKAGASLNSLFQLMFVTVIVYL